MNFIGIDVHKKQSQICVLDEQGEVCFETRVPTTRAHLKDAVLIYKGAKVLLESSTPSACKSAGIRCKARGAR